MQGAWKVGLLVVVFVVLLIGAYAVLGQSLFAPKTNKYYADFKDAGGITAGTSVLMAGVKVGIVKKVTLLGPSQAQVEMEIDNGIGIPEGSSAMISTALIGIGSQPLSILPPERGSTAMLPPNSVIHGKLASAIDSFLPDAKDTIKELNKTLVAAQGLLADQKLRGGVEKLLETSNQTVEKFGLIASKTANLLDSNQLQIQRAVNNAAAAMQDIHKSTSLLAQFAQDPKWRDTTVAMLDKLNKTSAKAEELVSNLNTFVTDPKLREPLNQTMANTQQITETGTRIATNAEEVSKNGIVMSQNGIKMTEKAIELEEKAKDIADEAKTMLKKLEGVFGKSAPVNPLGGITASLDFLRESKPGHVRTDAEVTIPLKKDSLHIGLFDAFEANKVNLQLGKPFGNGNEFRYGIYASKPGIGVDYRLAPRVYLRGDLFDFNEPRADIRARFEFGNGFYGWLGLDQVFKNNAPIVGVGIRR